MEVAPAVGMNVHMHFGVRYFGGTIESVDDGSVVVRQKGVRASRVALFTRSRDVHGQVICRHPYDSDIVGCDTSPYACVCRPRWTGGTLELKPNCQCANCSGTRATAALISE